MLKKQVKKVRQVENSGIKADALWATSPMKGEGMGSRAQALRQQCRMKPGEGKRRGSRQKMTRTRMAGGQILTRGRRSPVLAWVQEGGDVSSCSPVCTPWSMVPMLAGPDANPSSYYPTPEPRHPHYPSAYQCSPP